jgi:hypothetical protein
MSVAGTRGSWPRSLCLWPGSQLTVWQVRVDQVLSTDVELVTLFKIAGVLQFYFTTISTLAGETCSLSALISELRANALKASACVSAE